MLNGWHLMKDYKWSVPCCLGDVWKAWRCLAAFVICLMFNAFTISLLSNQKAKIALQHSLQLTETDHFLVMPTCMIMLLDPAWLDKCCRCAIEVVLLQNCKVLNACCLWLFNVMSHLMYLGKIPLLLCTLFKSGIFTLLLLWLRFWPSTHMVEIMLTG